MSTLDAISFIFADREDIYFTRHLLMLEFQPYFFLKQRKKKYKNVIFFKPANKTHTEVRCMTEEANGIFQKIQNKDLLSWIMGGSPIPKKREVDKKYYTWSVENRYINTVIESFLSNDNEAKKQFTLFIDIETLVRLFPNAGYTANFINMIKDINAEDGSIIKIVCPLNLAGEIPFIIKYILDQQGIDVSAVDDIKAAINSCPKINSEIWDPFEDEQIERMKQRIHMEGLLLKLNENDINSIINRAISRTTGSPIRDRRSLYKEIERSMKGKRV